jgi:septal ring factor EnvC (AmiA/AmiB activator)
MTPARSRAALLGLLAGLATVAADPPPRQALRQAERQRAQLLAAQHDADARLAAARDEQARLVAAQVAAAARQQQADAAVQAAAERLAGLAAQRAAAERRLAARAADMVRLLPLIERLSLYPAETVLAVPAPPEDALRGVLVLKGLAHELAAEAAALRAEQDQVAALTQAVDAALPALRQAQAAQAAQAAAVDRQLAAARDGERAAEDSVEEVARQAAAAGGRADSLREAIARIAASRTAAQAAARDEAARAERQRRDTDAQQAALREQALAEPAGPGLRGEAAAGAPVAGRVLRGFGEPGDAGPAQGVSYEAAPAARVVAACTGRAVFAAPFRSFGLLLILDCGGGYHFVMAGLQRLDVQVGHAVQAGQPVGVMPDWDPRKPGPRPVLYVELRHDGQPVNPAPWLNARS